jgi:ribonuclease HIII
LPKGASKSVVETARRIVHEHGTDVLRTIAKLHFSITKTIS